MTTNDRGRIGNYIGAMSGATIVFDGDDQYNGCT